MSTNEQYWKRTRLGRRAMFRGAGVGFAGLAGAALIGCGASEDSDGGNGGNGGQVGQQTDTRAEGGAVAGATAAAEGEVRIAPGIYDGPVGPTAAEADPAAHAKRGGTLKLRYLDPPRMDLNRTLSCTIYHTLNYTNNKLVRGRTGAVADPYRVEIEPDLAESWEGLEENTQFTFNLRRGVKTHNVAPANGRELTSEDVVAGLEMYRAGGSQQDVYAAVESIEAPDDHTVVVKLSEPLGDFPTNIASWSFIYLKELVDDEDLRQEKAIGTGPFIQEEWTRKERSVFSKHPDYFEEGLPYVDRIEVFPQSDPNALRSGFTTNNFMDLSVRDEPDFESMLQQNRETMVGSKFPRSRGANVNGFQFQMKNPVFQDERVRRALSLAFDRNEYDLARNSGDNQNPDGAYSNAPMPWPYLFDTYPTQKENGPWYLFDPEQAAQLMQAAGYSSANPLEFELASFYYDDELAELVIPGINQNLAEAKINWRQVDNPTHVTMMSDRSFKEAVGFLWGPPGYSMDQWIYPFYHSKGGTNYGSIEDPELDTLLEKQRVEADPDALKETWRAIWDRIHDQVYQAWFPEPLMRVAWHNYMLNFRWHALMGSYTCYASDQARAIWLDDGAPTAGR